MSYFHPVIRATWYKTEAFLLPVFAAERFISVVRRNKFTLLRNIEFVKFSALMCLALGLLLSMPRISWYKVTYMRWYPDPPRNINPIKIKSFRFVPLPNNSILPDVNELIFGIYRQFSNGTLSTSHYNFDHEETRLARTLYFRENNNHSLYRKSYILENTTVILAYLVALGLTACSMIFLCLRRGEIKQSRKADLAEAETGNQSNELFYGIFIKSLNNTNGRAHPSSNEEGVRRNLDSNEQSRDNKFRLLNYIVAPISLLNIFTTTNRNPHKERASYAIIVTPENEITLLKVQVWSTVFKFLCLFPLPIMTLLYSKFQKQHSYIMSEEEIANSHGFANSLPYINFLEFCNAALTPCLMILLIPEMRKITSSLFNKIFHFDF